MLLAAFAAARLPAQSIQTLCLFNGTNGANPVAALTLGTDGNFYGTTEKGGSNVDGTVFKVTTDGTLTTLVTFDYTNANGYWPEAGLTLGSDGNFYGTTSKGGRNNWGTVFKVTPTGTLTTLVSFPNGYDKPVAGLTLGNDGNFYGTTLSGGSNYEGSVFKVTTNGVLTTLVSFFGYPNGGQPEAGLTLGSDGNFYGTTSWGGSNYCGTVFKVTTDGTLTTLVSLPYAQGSGLTLGNDGNFYSTTSGGGSNGYGYGTVFKVTTNGVLTTLVSFAYTNGAQPAAGLTLGNDGNFYGTTSGGGIINPRFTQAQGCGTVFRLLLPPIITAPTMLANGQFQFSFNTVTRVDYAVQYSTNLTQWFPLVTISGVGIPLTLIDPNTAGSQQRFYRIILSPQ